MYKNGGFGVLIFINVDIYICIYGVVNKCLMYEICDNEDEGS